MFQQNWSKTAIAVPGTVPQCDWQSWAKELLFPRSSLSNGRAIWEEIEMLEILGSSERVMRRVLTAWKHLHIYPSFPLWAVPLMLLPGEHSTPPSLLWTGIPGFLWGCSSFLMQKFILAQAKGWFGCWTFTMTGQMFNAWAQASKHAHICPRASFSISSRCIFLSAKLTPVVHIPFTLQFDWELGWAPGWDICPVWPLERAVPRCFFSAKRHFMQY